MNSPDNDRIRKRAYEIWEREGRPHGRDEHHWHAALREIGTEASAEPGAASGKQPAAEGTAAEQPHSNADARLSDSPAATLPDTPIVTARPKRTRTPAKRKN